MSIRNREPENLLVKRLGLPVWRPKIPQRYAGNGLRGRKDAGRSVVERHRDS